MDRKNSCLIGLAYTMLGLILLTYPLWRHKPEATREAKTEVRNKTSSGFQYSLPPEYENEMTQNTESKRKVMRQLDRHSRNQANGFYDRVVLNPEMPEEIRSRFTKEKERLEQLAESYPDEMQAAQSDRKTPLVNPDGSFSPEFKEVVGLMKMYGVWDQLADAHLMQMIEDANNPDLPEEHRPTAEEIDAAKRQRLIPVM